MENTVALRHAKGTKDLLSKVFVLNVDQTNLSHQMVLNVRTVTYLTNSLTKAGYVRHV